MKPLRWSSQKNELLQGERGVSFEMVVVAIDGGLVEILQHPNSSRYPQRQILVVVSDGSAYLVPYVEESDHFFLKTVIPSRKATRTNVGGVRDDEDRSVRVRGPHGLRIRRARVGGHEE